MCSSFSFYLLSLLPLTWDVAFLTALLRYHPGLSSPLPSPFLLNLEHHQQTKLPKIPLSATYMLKPPHCCSDPLAWHPRGPTIGSSLPFPSFFFLIYLIYLFLLRWVSVAVHGFSLVVASRGYSSLRCTGFSWQWLFLLRSVGCRHTGFSSCGTWAQ